MTETEPPTAVDPGVTANRRAWTAALRSGNYRQATGALRVDDEEGRPCYCCLGVVEDLRGAEWRSNHHGDENDDLETSHLSGSHHVTMVGYAESTTLTECGCVWLGVAERNPYVTVRNSRDDDDDDKWVTVQLVDLNDDWGVTFKGIAAVIDDQPASWTGDEELVRTETDLRNARDVLSIDDDDEDDEDDEEDDE